MIQAKAVPIQKSGLFQTGSRQSTMDQPCRTAPPSSFGRYCDDSCPFGPAPSGIRGFHSPSSAKNQHKTNTFLTPPAGSGVGPGTFAEAAYLEGLTEQCPCGSTQNQIISNTDPQGGSVLILILILFRGATEPRRKIRTKSVQHSCQNPFTVTIIRTRRGEGGASLSLPVPSFRSTHPKL
jgi:hypothetical protein